jgi:hypothetical protein
MAIFSSDPGKTGGKAGRDKPRLWAEGRQRPGFDLRAYLRVSVSNSRTLAAPVLLGLAGRLDRFGTRVEDGAIRIPAARLGRTGRWLPSHVATGRRLRDSAAMTRIAAEAARGEGPVEGLPFRGWSGTPDIPAPVTQVPAERAPDPAPVVERTPVESAPVQRPSRPAPLPAAPAAGAEGDRDTLDVIRNLMATAAVEPVHPVRSTRAAPPPPPPTGVDALPELAPAEPAPRSALFKLTGKVLGAVSVGLALPVGLVQALIAFARGEDLRLVS